MLIVVKVTGVEVVVVGGLMVILVPCATGTTFCKAASPFGSRPPITPTHAIETHVSIWDTSTERLPVNGTLLGCHLAC